MLKIKSYVPLAKNKKFHRSEAEFRLLQGAYGSGKTTAMIWEFIDLCMKFSGIAGFMCRKYNEDLEATTQAIFYRECPEQLIDDIEGGGKRCYFINGSHVTFGGIYTRQKLRLKIPVVSLIGVDELIELDHKDFIDLVGRKRGDSTAKDRIEGVDYPLLFIAASNPPNHDHWIHEKFVEDKNPNYAIFKTSMYDNPYLDKTYIETCEKEYGKNESLFRRFVLGEFGFVSYGTPVFQGFKEAIHVRDYEVNPDKPVLRGWDFGFNRPCCVFAQFDNEDRLVLLDTVLGNKIHLEPFIDRIIKHSNEHFHYCKEWKDYCDIEGSYKDDNSDRTSVEIMNDKGIYPKFMKTSVNRGIEMLQKRMNSMTDGIPNLTIKRGNKLMKEAFLGGYYYARNTKGSGFKEEPEKDGFYDHMIDPTRYIINFYYKMNDSVPKHIRMDEPSFITNNVQEPMAGRYFN